jgi:hypothetical protein
MENRKVSIVDGSHSETGVERVGQKKVACTQVLLSLSYQSLTIIFELVG